MTIGLPPWECSSLFNENVKSPLCMGDVRFSLSSCLSSPLSPSVPRTKSSFVSLEEKALVNALLLMNNYPHLIEILNNLSFLPYMLYNLILTIGSFEMIYMQFEEKSPQGERAVNKSVKVEFNALFSSHVSYNINSNSKIPKSLTEY